MTSATGLTAAEERQIRLRGIALMCLAGVFFSGLDTAAKLLVVNYAAMQIVFVRYLGHFAMTVVTVGPTKLPQLWRTDRPGLLVLRGVLLFVSTLLNFLALRHLALSETVSIMFAAPFLIAVLAGPMLGEWIGPRRWFAVLTGFLGVLIVTQPGLAGFQWPMLYSVAGACGYALYAIITRIVAATDGNPVQQFYASLVGWLPLLPVMPFIWVWPQDLASVGLMLATGIFGFIGHGMLISAHRHAPAAILSPFGYVQIIWMILLGYLVFGDIPGAANLIGAGIVIASGLYLLFRERKVQGADT